MRKVVRERLHRIERGISEVSFGMMTLCLIITYLIRERYIRRKKK